MSHLYLYKKLRWNQRGLVKKAVFGLLLFSYKGMLLNYHTASHVNFVIVSYMNIYIRCSFHPIAKLFIRLIIWFCHMLAQCRVMELVVYECNPTLYNYNLRFPYSSTLYFWSHNLSVDGLMVKVVTTQTTRPPRPRKIVDSLLGNMDNWHIYIMLLSLWILIYAILVHIY